MEIFKPFSEIGKNKTRLLYVGWFVFMILFWGISSVVGDVHMFPSMKEVGEGFAALWSEGLVVHIATSLILCFKAVLLGIFFSLIIAYGSLVPLFKPVTDFISKFRYLPLTGISFYLVVLIKDARSMQVWLLMIFMITYLVTSLLGVISDIKETEINHARTLGSTRWETLLEVVIKGRLDYVIEAIRQNFAMLWFALVTVESIVLSSGGIGVLIKNSSKFLDHGRIVALQIIILIIGVGLDKLLTVVRKMLFPYSKF